MSRQPPVREALAWAQVVAAKTTGRHNEESGLQAAIWDQLRPAARVLGLRVEREHPYQDARTGKRVRFDFTVETEEGLLVIEVKMKGSPQSLGFQLHQYAALDGVAGVLLVTTKNALARIVAEPTMATKPIGVVNLAFNQI